MASRGADIMPRSDWTSDELAVLERHIDQHGWMGKVRGQLPGRSRSAIHARMMKLRAELNHVDAHDNMAHWRADAVNGSQKLLEALQAAAA